MSHQRTNEQRGANRKRQAALVSRRKAAGLCIWCGGVATNGQFCEEHYQKKKSIQKGCLERRKAKRASNRQEVLEISCQREELAYAAGLVDGEGCIHFSHPKKKTSASICLRVAMTNADAVAKMANAFGGSVTEKKWKTDKYLVQKLWLVSGKRAYNTLVAILPFLVAKRQQAELGIEYWERMSVAEKTGYRRTEHTKESVSYIRRCLRKMKALKKNGGK